MVNDKTFTLISDNEDEWHWSVLARIRFNGTFASRGTIQLFKNENRKLSSKKSYKKCNEKRKEHQRTQYQLHREEEIKRCTKWNEENKEKYN